MPAFDTANLAHGLRSWMEERLERESRDEPSGNPRAPVLLGSDEGLCKL